LPVRMDGDGRLSLLGVASKLASFIPHPRLQHFCLSGLAADIVAGVVAECPVSGCVAVRRRCRATRDLGGGPVPEKHLRTPDPGHSFTFRRSLSVSASERRRAPAARSDTPTTRVKTIDTLRASFVAVRGATLRDQDPRSRSDTSTTGHACRPRPRVPAGAGQTGGGQETRANNSGSRQVARSGYRSHAGSSPGGSA